MEAAVTTLLITGALIVNTIALMIFINKYFDSRANLREIRYLLLDNEEITNRYPDPDDNRYAPSVRDMVRDMREIQEIVDEA